MQSAFTSAKPAASPRLSRCASGRELIDAGFAADVEIAAQHDASEVVPVLMGESFRSSDELESPGPHLRRVDS